MVENSQFDNNEDGFDTNSQNGDNPPPQNGACPATAISPITHTHSCWVFMHNYVHDNNNPNVPAAGSAAAGPVGTGMSVSGGRNDTIMDNRFVNNNAWGVDRRPLPGQRSAVHRRHARLPLLGTGSCLYDDWGDALIDNTFTHNGGYGNPTNGDFEQLNFVSAPDRLLQRQHRGRRRRRPARDAAADADRDARVCTRHHGRRRTAATTVPERGPVRLPGADRLRHARRLPAGGSYPRVTKIVMHPLPKGLKTMPNPCAGVPSNPWCKVGGGG